MTPGTGADLLTHTTLQVDGGGAGASLTHMVRALRRVPGVLLAEVNAANARAVVAHDAAVPATSLIAAAENVGVRLSIVSDTRAPVLGDSAAARVHHLDGRQLLIAAAASFVIVSIVDLLVPNATLKHAMLIVTTVSLWAFFLAKSFVGHR